MSRLVVSAALIAVLLLAAGAAVLLLLPRDRDRFAACREGQIAGGAGSIGGPFELVNGAGETVTDSDVITAPALIYFGYTFCPDVCPLDNARNAAAVEILEARGISAVPVFISVDPARDTPEVVGEFASNFHDRMIGLTGSPDQVRAASRVYRTYYQAHEAEDDYYLVDHSTFTYLALPETGFVDVVRREASPEEVADQVACYVDAA